jgi:hypothetical protein
MTDDDQPIEVALAAARRRLDALIAKHPELVGPTGPDLGRRGRSRRWRRWRSWPGPGLPLGGSPATSP